MTATQEMVQCVDGLWLIRIPKGLLVLTTAQFVAALKRGKGYRRSDQLAKRLNADIPEA